jgi:hypothetical protein
MFTARKKYWLPDRRRKYLREGGQICAGRRAGIFGYFLFFVAAFT